MKVRIYGTIENFVPSFSAYLDGDKNLILSEDGDLSLSIDTGFSGGVALPDKIIDEMCLELIDFDTFRLATGEIVELPVFLGKIIIKNYVVETWFVPGDSLIGMEFLALAGSILSLNFKEGIVKLIE